MDSLLHYQYFLARKKKSKLKKMFVPILVFIVIKAMTLIPLALGILGIKAWNATQLSFISFVSSLAMAIWKLCSKVSHEPPQVIHQSYDPHLHHFHDRQDAGVQQMAYSGYPQQWWNILNCIFIVIYFLF